MSRNILELSQTTLQRRSKVQYQYIGMLKKTVYPPEDQLKRSNARRSGFWRVEEQREARQWNIQRSRDLKLPQKGKPAGGGGTSVSSPTLKTTSIPAAEWKMR